MKVKQRAVRRDRCDPRRRGRRRIRPRDRAHRLRLRSAERGRRKRGLPAKACSRRIPDADGIVGDLGGGSLELVDVSGGRAARGISLPLGVLRLSASAAASATRAQALKAALKQVGLARARQGPRASTWSAGRGARSRASTCSRPTSRFRSPTNIGWRRSTPRAAPDSPLARPEAGESRCPGPPRDARRWRR